jgi:hypothetical protein
MSYPAHQLRTFYIAAIQTDGMTRSASVYGHMLEAQQLLGEWIARGKQANGWDKPMVFATIADTNGILLKYVPTADGNMAEQE